MGERIAKASKVPYMGIYYLGGILWLLLVFWPMSPDESFPLKATPTKEYVR